MVGHDLIPICREMVLLAEKMPGGKAWCVLGGQWQSGSDGITQARACRSTEVGSEGWTGEAPKAK